MLVKNIEEAAIRVKDVFRQRGVKIVLDEYVNKKRHYILTTDGGSAYYILYKRAFFFSFGKVFNKEGVGESINESFINLAITRNITSFLVVYENGHVYMVTPKAWDDYATINNTIRETDSGERTFSIPVNMLRRWDNI